MRLRLPTVAGESVAVAVAPLPLPPLMVIVGGEV